MTPEQKAAFVIAQAACAMAECAAMQAANAAAPEPVFTPMDFRALEQTYMIGHNAVIEFMR